jgi:hypothetical protein
MKVVEIFLVSDGRIESILPYQKEDLIAYKKNRKVINLAFEGTFLKSGFWKITIKSYFFGIYKQLTLEQLRMPL